MRRLEFTSFQVRDIEISKEFYMTKLGFELSEIRNLDAVIFKFNKGEASFAIRKPLENLENKELVDKISATIILQSYMESIHKY